MKNLNEEKQLKSTRKFRTGQSVFDTIANKKVRFLTYINSETAKVSVLVDHDKNTGVVSTKNYDVLVSQLVVDRSKRKSNKPRYRKTPYQQVREFQKVFGHPVGDVPQMLNPEREAKRLAWKEEEIQEQKDATTLVDKVDALIDQLYFIYGDFVEMGVDPQPLFDIVQRANMGKIWDDGVPRFRESDNKIMKPPHWEEKFAPEKLIEKELEKQKYFAQKRLTKENS